MLLPSGFNHRIAARTFLRTYTIMAGFNTKGMQNIGLAYAMEPGLRTIYKDDAEYAEARTHYLRHYNTHPFMTPLLVGILLSAEGAICRGLMSREMLQNIEKTTIYTLSAIGDSFFGGSVSGFWALSMLCLIVSGHTALAMLWGCVLFAGLQAFKGMTFLWGLKEGFRVLTRLRKLNLINKGRALKYVNSVLLVLLWMLIWPATFVWWQWLMGVSILGVLTWSVIKSGLSREWLVLGVIATTLFLPLIYNWFAGTWG